MVSQTTLPDDIQAIQPLSRRLMLPPLLISLLFTMSFLDRVNVGVAKLAGLTTDLNLTTNKFNNISVIFFVSYVAFEIPSNLILKKMRPSRWIPTIMILWAAVQISMGFVKNYGELECENLALANEQYI